MEEKLRYKELIFEITRKCNMSCQHCMRGEAESKSITKEVIDKALDQVELILNLVLTGGEPFIEPEMIDYLFTGIIKRKIPLLKVLCMTNGKILNKEIAHSFNKIGNYIYKNCPDQSNKKAVRTLVQITISNDKYHDKVDFTKVTTFYRKYLNDHCIIVKEKLKENERVLNMGKAEELPEKKRYSITPYRVEIDEEYQAITTGIQIGHDGKVLIGEDSSYQQQDTYNYGNIFDRSIYKLLLDGAFNEPFIKTEAVYHDEVYTKWMNKEDVDGTAADDELMGAWEFGLKYFELVYAARKRLSECYPLSYDEVVEAAYHEVNAAVKEELGNDIELQKLNGDPITATYEESYKKRLQLQLIYPMNAILAGLKYKGVNQYPDEIPQKLDKSHYKKLKLNK